MAWVILFVAGLFEVAWAVGLKYSAGWLGHDALSRSIGLYGREVIPRVRELLAQPAVATAD